ncbi:hypothetical protein ACWDCB_44130 [Streptomyces sp. NPDC001178]
MNERTSRLGHRPAAPSTEAPPFLELRVGGLHLTVHHAPYRLLTFAAALIGGGGASWMLR